MTLRPDDFPEFFSALRGGQPPFVWQERLLAGLLSDGRWPDQIVAPTGAGKTAVIDVHVFAVALMAAGTGPHVPRRLSLVVDRRALVDSQHDLAIEINDSLRKATRTGSGPLAEVARLLLGLRSGHEPDPDPLLVAMLRGGSVPARRWVDDPAAAAIICATPDMWGSRLLFRGYGSGRMARPREAGLLAYDSVVVVDEAHLARQLIATARRIDALEAMAAIPLGVPRVQVVAATATPGRDQGLRSVGVTGADLVPDQSGGASLARRLCTPKHLTLVPLADWPAESSGAKRVLATTMADVAAELLHTYGRTVACVTNTVGAALGVATELRARGHTTEVLVGRMRPHDIRALRERKPGLLTPAGDPEVDVVVATQTIEVGIDADFSAMVTELAPGSAIAQRAGRVNRLGREGQTDVRIVVPEGEGPAKDAPPYARADLVASRDWLTRRAASADGLAPWAISGDPPPEAGLPRVVLGRPEPWDAALLARTSDDLIAEPDLALWLSDELEPDTDVSLVVRAGIPAGSLDAISLLRATPPRAAECFPVSLRTLTSIADEGPKRRRFRWRGDDLALLEDGDSLRPGDIVVVDDDVTWFSSGVVDPNGSERAQDVLEEPRASEPVLLRIGPGTPFDLASGGRAGRDLVEALVSSGREIAPERARHTAMAHALEAFAASVVGLREGSFGGRSREIVRLLRGRLADVEVIFGPAAPDAEPGWLVIADVRRNLGDEHARQTWSPAAQAILLDDHEAGVAGRAAELGTQVALRSELVDALVRAGELHDEGKRDPRFQRLLGGEGATGGGSADEAVLAKSGLRTPSEQRAAASAAGLPSGWRHEQLSAVIAQDRTHAGDREAALVVRLVGTSHGHGRVGFPHTSAGLLGGSPALAEPSEGLHDPGDWNALFESTHRTYGVWGCAYLEAILRAADGQVSREGG
jgi:CRISPR-associated endonuclease/helicase Cas3